MLLDAKKLWIEGGYGLNNNFEVSLQYIHKFGADHNVDANTVDTILAEFFLELKDDPTKYMTEDHKCFCGCDIGNSGTNAIHTICKRIKERQKEIIAQKNKLLTDSLNEAILNHIHRENDKYLAENMPPEDTRTFAEKHLGFLDRWFGDK